MADDDSSVDSDGWGAEELVIPPKGGGDTTTETNDGGNNDDDDDDDDYWKVEPKASTPTANEASGNASGDASSGSGGTSMILVDLTRLDPTVHSKFDKNSVSDSERASELRKAIERDYDAYGNDANRVADGTVIPCGSSVWRQALVKLRSERPGHYFVPIFPPKTDATK